MSMGAVSMQFEYLIGRAKREKNPELAEQLTVAYNKYLDSATS